MLGTSGVSRARSGHATTNSGSCPIPSGRAAPNANAAVALPRPRYGLVDWLAVLTLPTLILASPLIFDLALRLGIAR